MAQKAGALSEANVSASALAIYDTLLSAKSFGKFRRRKFYLGFWLFCYARKAAHLCGLLNLAVAKAPCLWLKLPHYL
jgi:hypothetical protein